MLNGEHCAFSTGEQIYDFIYITDAAKTFIEIAKKGIANRTYWNAGCPLLSGSHLERAVYQTLSNLGVAFQAEKTFDDFKTTFDKFYRFDCYLDKEKLIIECDGEQHFIEVDQFGGKTGFQQTIASEKTYILSQITSQY